MKKIISTVVNLLVLLFILSAPQAKAYSTSDLLEYTNWENGCTERGILLIQSNVIYGTMHDEGPGETTRDTDGTGIIYRMNIDGTGYTNLYAFSGDPSYTNFDGASPSAGLIISSNVLYGVTEYGGTGTNGIDYGTVFRLNTDGTCFTNLHNFIYTDGASPSAELTLVGNVLYGTTKYSRNGSGTIFKVNTDGTGFSTLYEFSKFYDTNNNYINTDGGYPSSRLIVLGNTLYGTTFVGGSNSFTGFTGFGEGVIFKIDTSGANFHVIHNFSLPTFSNGGNGFGYGYTNSDGFFPNTLTAYSNVLYGTMTHGGYWNCGILFKIETNGNFTDLCDFAGEFSGETHAYGNLAITNNVIFGCLDDEIGTLFWTATGSNLLYRINTDGTHYQSLCGLSGLTVAKSGLVISGHTLYGLGGMNLIYTFYSGFSEVFAMDLTPPPIVLSANQSNYTFESGMTYYISNSISISGTTTIQGGAVIKYAPGTSITVEDVDCQTTSNNPAIFTARDDDTVGVTLSDSTHSPSGYYANSALVIENDTFSPVHDINFNYADLALQLYNFGDSVTYSLKNLLMQNCGGGFDYEGNSGDSIMVTNLTMTNCGSIGGGYFINGEIHNSTFVNVDGLVSDDGGYGFNSVNFSYCTLSNVTLYGFCVNIGGDHNGFHNCSDYFIETDGWGNNPDVHGSDHFGSNWYYY